MNLYFRLIWVIIRSRFRARITSEHIYNEVGSIVFPNDLDINLHMNNGRFLTLCDLGRVDLFVRSGLFKVMRQQKWIPVVASVSMTYIKSLYLFEQIRIVSHITHWDEKYFYSTHSIYRRDELVAEGTSKALIVSRKSGRVTPESVIETVNLAMGN